MYEGFYLYGVFLSWFRCITRSLEPYIAFLFSNLCHSVFYLTAKCHTVQWVYERFFHSCVFWVKLNFGQMSISLYFLPFILSAICPIGQMSFGHMSIRSFVCRSYVRSSICLSAIWLTYTSALQLHASVWGWTGSNELVVRCVKCSLYSFTPDAQISKFFRIFEEGNPV